MSTTIYNMEQPTSDVSSNSSTPRPSSQTQTTRSNRPERLQVTAEDLQEAQKASLEAQTRYDMVFRSYYGREPYDVHVRLLRVMDELSRSRTKEGKLREKLRLARLKIRDLERTVGQLEVRVENGGNPYSWSSLHHR